MVENKRKSYHGLKPIKTFLGTLPQTNSKSTRKWAVCQKDFRSYSNHPFSGAFAVSFRKGININSWWFQPIWKILVNSGSFPQVRVKVKNLWNHQPVCHHSSNFLAPNWVLPWGKSPNEFHEVWSVEGPGPYQHFGMILYLPRSPVV